MKRYMFLFMAVCFMNVIGTADMFGSYQCQSDYYYPAPDHLPGLQGVQQSDVDIDNATPSFLCPGQWRILRAKGGDDCDNVWEHDGSGPCGGSDLTCEIGKSCVRSFTNQDSPYQWEISGAYGRMQIWSDPNSTLRENCAIEALPGLNDSQTITITLSRNEASTVLDPAVNPSITKEITVVPPPPKQRSVAYSSQVTSWAPIVCALNAGLWALDARTDRDMPVEVPGGGSEDNHECVYYEIFSAERDLSIPDPIEYYYPRVLYLRYNPNWPGYYVGSKNITIVNGFSGVVINPEGSPPAIAAGYGDCPGEHIYVTYDALSAHVLGHEWGHNGGLGDDLDYIAPFSVMSYGTSSTDITVDEVGHWAGQTAAAL